jgi:DNA-binding NarL/FixJ family response regulator
MSVLLASTDLMFAPRVSDAARALGGTCRMVSAGQLAEALNPETRLVLLDLSLAGLDPQQVVASVRSSAPSAGVVAFGPHVHEARLEAARAAGCNEVVSRGELHGRLPAILARYLAAPPSGEAK